MRKIRDVLRYRHSAGLSLEAIARALKISKGVVAKYLRLATVAGLTWPIPEDLDDAGLEKLLYQQVAAREPTFAEPDYALVHQELKKKGVTLTLFSVEGREVRIGGSITGSASDLISILEQSAVFENVQFTSPVASRGEIQEFQIRAFLEGRKEKRL